MAVMDYKWTMIKRVSTACHTVYDVCKSILPLNKDFIEETTCIIIMIIIIIIIIIIIVIVMKLMVEVNLDASSHNASNTSTNELWFKTHTRIHTTFNRSSH